MSQSWQMRFFGSEPSSASDEGRLADIEEEYQELRRLHEEGRSDEQLRALAKRSRKKRNRR